MKKGNLVLLLSALITVLFLISCSQRIVKTPEYISNGLIESMPKDAALAVLQRTLGHIAEDEGLKIHYFKKSLFSINLKKSGPVLIKYEDLYFSAGKRGLLSGCAEFRFHTEPDPSVLVGGYKILYESAQFSSCDDARDAVTALLSLGAKQLSGHFGNRQL